jgi:hypothetical protein
LVDHPAETDIRRDGLSISDSIFKQPIGHTSAIPRRDCARNLHKRHAVKPSDWQGMAAHSKSVSHTA